MRESRVEMLPVHNDMMLCSCSVFSWHYFALAVLYACRDSPQPMLSFAVSAALQ